ncbi:O-antigen ligase family protein [Janthinobacterium sp. PAMC25594]|uniref:O-antigen ligase family protein n=1 Tax=Janthinobacterium sp. PAMC25594 TaxID=2861284 RepID=UPI001C6306A6|nr:O-antigen ligase family protein [Janthinobacterium sp. PAMC25594]QYG05612.1 O-antigen ligase family protein [Janthinobacterium sp. PAMC25594]
MNNFNLIDNSTLRHRNYVTLQVLFFFGMIAVCFDVINIDLGNFKLKIAYVWFFIYLILFSFFFKLSIKKNNLTVSAVFLVSLFPSLFFSNNIITSLAFYAGAVICIVIMLIFSKMTILVAPKVIPLLFNFYRFSIILTVIFVVARIQERGHFLLYESSYYAVVLIPYFCMTFYRLFLYGFKCCFADLFLIFIAIVFTQSVSMVGWSILSFFCIYMKSGLSKRIHFIAIFLVIILFFILAYFLNSRAQIIINRFFLLFENPSDSLSLFIFVVGNRLQRVFIAYEAFMQNPLFGVGLGVLREYSTNNFDPFDFVLNGVTASDFTVNSPAANVFVEVAAESGIIGFLGYMCILIYIHGKKGNEKLLTPLKVSFYVTMFALLIDASYLRNYVWALYGIVIGLSSLSPEVSSKLSFDPKINKTIN